MTATKAKGRHRARESVRSVYFPSAKAASETSSAKRENATPEPAGPALPLDCTGAGADGAAAFARPCRPGASIAADDAPYQVALGENVVGAVEPRRASSS